VVRNFLLAVILSLLVVTLWTSQQHRSQPSAQEQAESASADRSAAAGDETEVARESDSAAAVAAAEAVDRDLPSAPAIEIELRGEGYRAVLSSAGAALVSYELTDPRFVSWDPPGNAPIDLLLSPEGQPARVGATPFEELGLGDLRRATFEVESRDSNGVTFAYRSRGVSIRKSYRFDPGSHAFELAVTVENASGEMLSPQFAIEWPANQVRGNDYAQLSLDPTLSTGRRATSPSWRVTSESCA